MKAETMTAQQARSSRDPGSSRKAIMESAGAQIRPLLTPQQQEKFDTMKKAHEDMHKAMQEMHDAEKK